MKKICFITAAVLSISLFTGCKKDNEVSESMKAAPGQSSASTSGQNYETEANDISEAPLENSENALNEENSDITRLSTELSYTSMPFFDSVYIDLNEYKKQKASIISKGSIINSYSIRDKLIVEISPENDESANEIGIFDPYNNSYKKAGDFRYSAAYGAYSFVMRERYYVIVTSEEADGKMKGCIRIYDIDADEFYIADTFDEHNIVNFATHFKDNSIAYVYYEAETQDWVVKSYDIESKESTEIFRQTNFNENSTLSPMSIASDGKNIMLAVQYIEGDTYKTDLWWIDKDGKLLKKENLDLNCIFGDYYEITDFRINGEYYFIDVKYGKDEETEKASYIFRRINDFMHTVEKGEVNKDYDMISDGTSIDEKSVVYSSYLHGREDMDGITDVILKEQKSINYEFNFDPDNELGVRQFTRVISGKDLFVLFRDDEGSDYEYRVVPDFRNLETHEVGNAAPSFSWTFFGELPEDYYPLVKE